MSHGIAQIKINLRNREQTFSNFSPGPRVLECFDIFSLEALEKLQFRVEMSFALECFFLVPLTHRENFLHSRKIARDK